MIKETVTMSHKELDRLHIIQESLNRHITQEQAAARIGISIRQVKRLVQRYRNEGPSGLVSRRRGKRPNNSFSTEFRATVISLLKGRYADFGPTLACEKLREIHGLCLSIETLRKWMVEEGIWRERRRKFARIYQRRMPTFIEAYNNRFATPPRIADNAHLDVHHSEEELGYIFSLQAKRVLSKNLTFQYKSSAFQIRSEGRGYRLRHSVVTVCESFNGEIKVLYNGKALGWEKYVDGPEPIPLDDEKSVHERVDNARFDLRSKFYVKPKADHPWLTRRTQSNQQVKPPKLPRKKADPDKMD
ncbi:helix-turn-helix domain-containing protein [Citrobacter freundii]|uniref:helix-turn-helix domain-containing protein n=1 Tax=Citrobacter freundii TaxID=546 RepID=UPI00070897B8|nr:helix-turn-helix domain-containing protein [Citrobacter freundii]EJC8217576.1 helix-turn-helix domain containing protein [Citrobacter freundii]